MTKDLIHFDRAKRELALATSIDEVKEIRDKAEALRQYAKQAGESLTMQNQCAEIKIRAERRAGELIPEQITVGTKSHDTTLSDLNISKDQSVKYQDIASIPEEQFEGHIAGIKDEDKELTSVGMQRLAKQLKQGEQTEIESPSLPENEFRVIVTDPPWPYGTQYDAATRRIASPYEELSLEKIVENHPNFANPSVLWLWTTHKFIFDAREIINEWGFDYKLTLVWNKEKMGMGKWLRCQAEFCLLGIKGKIGDNWQLKNQRDVISIARREHSRKPDEFYQIVEELCPGPLDETFYLEMYAREQRAGWYSWGKEKHKFEKEI